MDDEDDLPAFAPISSRRKTHRLAITSGDGPESAGSMPGLQTVSHSSDDDDDDDDDEEEENHGDNYSDSEYDTEEEDEIREMVKEAMFIAREGDFFDSGDNIPSEIDPFLQEDNKGSPFLKLLGSLRGLFVSR